MNDKKVVLITGGGRGIGFGLAKAFAKHGYHLVLTGRTEETLMNAKKELEDMYSVKVLPVVADGSDENSVKSVIDQIQEKFGRLDTVINNAQSSKSGVMLVDHSKEDFDLAIYSGLYASFFYMKYAYPLLKKTQGNVINFASGAGINGRLGQASYAASKEGIRGLSRVAATEWGPDLISVNVLCPLAMTEGLEKWRMEYPDLYDKTIQDIPMGRFADPEQDIGELCVYLSSEPGHYITGETISLQGGSGLRP